MEKRHNIPLARDLRERSTDAERVLWRVLRARKLNGWKFRRQFPLGPYIVDLVCIDARLVIEIDGGQHAEQMVSDYQRTRVIEAMGYRVLRFWNNQALQELEAVIEEILRNLSPSHPHPNPLPPAGEGGH